MSIVADILSSWVTGSLCIGVVVLVLAVVWLRSGDKPMKSDDVREALRYCDELMGCYRNLGGYAEEIPNVAHKSTMRTLLFIMPAKIEFIQDVLKKCQP